MAKKYSGEDNRKGQKPNNLRNKIILWLAENPDKTNTEIMIGVGNHHDSAISRVMSQLKTDGYVDTLPETNWLLTDKGLDYAKNTYMDEPRKNIKISVRYSKYYQKEEDQSRVYYAFEMAAGDRSEYVLKKGQQFLWITSQLNLTDEEWGKMNVAFLSTMLGIEGILKYEAALKGKDYNEEDHKKYEDFQREWKAKFKNN